MRLHTPVIAIILLFVLVSAAAGYALWRQGAPSGPSGTGGAVPEQCALFGGAWLSDHEECEFAPEEWCAMSAGGRFDECASACRHNPDPGVPCTLQCVPVCAFGSATPMSAGTGPGDAVYEFEGNEVRLTDGSGRTPSGQVVLWAQAPIADIDGDGDGDVVLVFATEDELPLHYVAASLAGADGFSGTNAVAIGEGVSLQTVHVRDGAVLVNYTDRHPWEPAAALPSVGRTKRLEYADERLREVARESLSSESARLLAVTAWGDCASPDCGTLTVRAIDGKDGVWYVDAVYDDLADDSIAAQRLTARVHDVENTWALGETLRDEVRCREGRGHQEFSAELCL